MSEYDHHPLSVLMFGWEFPPYISGGLGTACHGLTQSMAASGTSITFVIPRANNVQQIHSHLTLIGCNQILPLNEAERKLCNSSTNSSIDIIHIDACLTPYQNTSAYGAYHDHVLENRPATPPTISGNGTIDIGGQYGENLIDEVLRYATVGKRLALRNTFDVIHAHDWMCYLAGIEAKKYSDKPLVCHVHATEFDRSGDTPNPDIYKIEQYGLNQADLVITVSHRTKDTIHQHYDIPLDKIRVVHNGVSREKHIQTQGVKHAYKEKLVLFLGRVTMQKGPEYFLEAAKRVLQVLPNVRFVMAGSGDRLPAMIDKIARMRLQDRFHFTGFLRGAKTEEMFAMSDVFVMPSVSEPFGLTPIEAMKYNTPTIISKQSGVSEVIKNTIKIDFWDVDKLTDAIIKILTDDAIYAELSNSGLAEINELSWDTAADKIISHYRELIKSCPVLH